MSTAISGLNEFPVLLRLPDLNAPAWAPLPVPVSSPAASSGATLTPFTTLTTIGAEATPSVYPTPEPTPAAPPAPRREPLGATLLARAARISSTNITVGQWTLIRQFATGGMLVGGLALTYVLIMGGGKEETPAHIPTAEMSLEPPVIEMAPALASDRNAPVVVRPENASSHQSIAEIPPPPDFGRDWQSAAGAPSHIEVAELPPRDNVTGRDTAPPTERAYPHSGSPPFPSRDGSPVHFEGRVGPDASASNVNSSYPTTDPATFIYRPTSDPRASGRINTAKLDGTIAPPPLR